MTARDKVLVSSAFVFALVIVALQHAAKETEPAKVPVPGHPGVVVFEASGTVLRYELIDRRAEPPLGCEIVAFVQPNGTFYGVRVGDFSLAPYALYDTRQGAD